VTVGMTAPNGRTTNLSGTTGTNGVASLNYRLSNSAAAGTYQLQAHVGTTSSGGGRNKGGAATARSTLGASASFTVQ
jgi:hypothetical protein